MHYIRYADLVLQSDMLIGQRDDGTTLQMTRQERALLICLTRKPHVLVSRLQLLQGLGDARGELNERNIDYLVNRLRKRLGDNARAPRFIATQYGEGYLWIADPVASEPPSAFLVIGPVSGLGGDEKHIRNVLAPLASRIGAVMGNGHPIACQPDYTPGAATGIDYRLEASLHEEQGCLHLALILKDGDNGSDIDSFRLTMPSIPSHAELNALAHTLTDAIWAHRALLNQPAQPGNPPLHLHLHGAGMLLSNNRVSWRENAPRLKQARSEAPDDPTLAVLLALNHYTQLIQEMTMPASKVDALEDEIEQLALGALPKVQDDPMLLFGVAKVLRFIDRGYLTKARQLADRAFEASTAFATAFALRGQVAASLGEIDQAIELYDKSMELADRGSQFHIYLLVIKGVALMAANRRNDVNHLTTELYALEPSACAKFGILFVSPRANTLTPVLTSVLETLSPASANSMLRYLYRVSVRQFQHRHHQLNVLRGAAVHFVKHFGSQAIPGELQRQFPELVNG